MRELESSISKHALDLTGSFLTKDDRVLIIGGTGWIGRTSATIASLIGIPSLLIASNSRNFQIAEQTFAARKWNEEEIVEFDPTVIIDAAFITREFAPNYSTSDYLEINRRMTKRFISASRGRSVRKVLTFSSGAAVAQGHQKNELSIDTDLYGYLKNESEDIVMKAFKDSELEFSLVRIWSVSGALATKVNEFAFSDFIDQARTNKINISSESKVYRRYCLAEEVIAIGLHHDSRRDGILDTGGTLVEIRDLAKLVAKVLNPTAKVYESEVKSPLENHYYSDSRQWDAELSRHHFIPASIEEQIRHVGSWLLR